MIPFPTSGFRSSGYPNWNPLDGTPNIVLTNFSETVSCAVNNVNGEGVRGTVGRTAGKRYFVFMMGSATTSGKSVGFGLTTLVSIIAGGTPSAAIVSFSGGTIFQQSEDAIVYNNGGGTQLITINNSSPSSAAQVAVAGDVVAFAADLTGGLVWFRNLNRASTGGQWNLSSNGNPSAATGGISITGLSSGKLFPVCYAAHGITGTAGIFNGGTSAFIGTIPTGYVGWCN